MDSNQFNNGQQPNPYFNNNSGYQQPQKAPNIFQQFAFSFVPSKYDGLAKVKTGSMIGFVVLLALVATLVQFIYFAISFTVVTNSNTLEDAIPEFELKNGILSIEREVEFNEGGMLIYITDEKDSFTYEDVKTLERKGYVQVMLIGRKNMFIMQNGKYQDIVFKDLGKGFSIDKDWFIEELIPIVWVCFCVGYVFYFVGRVLWYFFCAAIYLLIGLIICSVMNKRVPAGALYRTAVYAKVPLFVVALLFSQIPSVGTGFLTLVRPIITIVFMVFAIQKLPD